MGLRGVGRGLNFGQALVKVGNDPVKTQDFLLRKYGRKSPMSKREPFLWSQRENWRGAKPCRDGHRSPRRFKTVRW